MTSGTFLRATIPAFALAIGLAGAAHAATHKKHDATAASGTRTALSGYQTKSAAQLACGSGAVVWHATGSKVFHTAKSRYFGKTKHGAYVCEKAAVAHHLHAARN